MRSVLLIVTLLAVLSHGLRIEDYGELFETYKVRFNKAYPNKQVELKARKSFVANMQWAAALQAENPLATFGMTEYTDVDRSEFKRTHHNANFTSHLSRRKPIQWDAPQGGQSIDWRTKGAVTHVKNQQQCGGCWSFSTTGNIEGQWFLGGHPLVSLSEQELISCDTQTGNSGCDGGLMDYAFEWIINYQGGYIELASSYPFVSGDGSVPSCQSSSGVNGAQISSYHDLPQSESSIASYCYSNGPVSIAVDAAKFQTYTGGILTNCGQGQLDHAVLIVGFDDTYTTPYWIIKNSWGTSWGESGYIRVAKGSNQCGLDQAATSSVVAPNTPPVPTGPPTPPSPPSPTPPTPPSPPTPAGGNFTFNLCTDSACDNCQSYSFADGVCVDEQFNGDSFTAQCSTDGTTITASFYTGSESCSGSPDTQTLSTNTCYENTDGQTFLTFVCP